MLEIIEEYFQTYKTVSGFNLFSLIIFSIASLALLKLFNSLFFGVIVKKLRKKTQVDLSKNNHLYASFQKVISMLSLLFSMSVAQPFLTLDASSLDFINHFKKALIIFVVFYSIAYIILPHIFERIFKNISSNAAQSQKEFILKTIKIIIIFLGILSILQSLGVNVSTLLTGLTITSTAIAFGSQDLIKNLFGSLAILFDNTFQPGDWIKSPDIEGNVERISLRTTTIRQFDKALVTIPNDKLANSALINYSRMTQRRILWNIGISHAAKSEQLVKIVSKLNDYVKQNPELETNPGLTTTIISIDQCDKYSINLFCSFFTKTIIWKEHMAIKEECLINFRRIIEEEGASIFHYTESGKKPSSEDV